MIRSKEKALGCTRFLSKKPIPVRLLATRTEYNKKRKHVDNAVDPERELAMFPSPRAFISERRVKNDQH